MRRALRWIKRIVLTAVALSVLAIAIVIGVVHTDWGRNKIRAEIVAQLQADFPGSTIGSLTGSPFGAVVLHDVTVMARDGKPLATIKELSVRAALRPLVSHEVRVDEISVRGVEVFVREQPPKPAGAPVAASEPSKWTIELPSISVDGARVTVQTATGIEVLDEVRVRAAARIPAGEPIAARVTVQGRWRGKPLSASAFAAIDGAETTIPFATAQLGAANVTATGLVLGPSAMTGAVHAEVPAVLVRELAQLELPGDAVVSLNAGASGAMTLDATVGGARAQGDLVADLTARTVKGIVTATVPDLATVTRGKVTGAGTVVGAISVDPARVRGLVTITGTVDGRAGTTTLALDATETHAELVASADAKEGMLAAHAVAARTGDAWTLTDATVKATAQGVEGLREARADIAAHGPLWPAPEVAFTGTVDASDYRKDATHVAAAHAELRGVARKDTQEVTATVTASGVRSGTTRVATARADVRGTARKGAQDFTATVTAGGVRSGTTLVATVHADLSGTAANDSQHVAATVRVTDVRSGTTRVPSASIAGTADLASGVIALALGKHQIHTADGATWAGSRGRVTVTDDAIVIEDVQTSAGTSRVTASARIGRLDKSLQAKVAARNVSLAIADPTLGGTVDADLDVTQRGVSWTGTASVRAHGVAMPNRPKVDGNLDVTLAGRKITVDGTVSNPQLGTTTLAVAVTGPRDITDARAWRKLPRTAISQIYVAIAKFDATPLGGSGTVDGELVLGPTDARGNLTVRGVTTNKGTIDADVTLSPGDGGSIAIAATAQTEGVPPATATAKVVLPARPFDPDAWKQLGRGALHGAKVETGTVRIDPALLARFGIVSEYSANVAATVEVDEAWRFISLTADVRGLRGGKLTSPIDIDIDGAEDENGVHADVRATSGAATLTLTAKTPMTVEKMLEPNAPSPPIEATIGIPDTRARDLLALLGETDVLAGVVGGTVTITGTVAAPDVRAKLAARGLAMKASSITNKKPPTLDLLEIDAHYTGELAELTLNGIEGEGRMLKITAKGNPRDPRSVNGSIEAANFDLAPLTAFGTGAVRAARGTLSASLRFKGFDPKTGSVRGQLAIRDGRLPLSPELGTLRRASVLIDVVGSKLTAQLDGRVGAGNGSVTGTLTSVLQGGVPQSAHLDAKIRKVSPIGAMQPQVDADLVGNWANTGQRWEGSLAVRNGKVVVPPETGSELLMTGAPADMVFVKQVKKVRHAPTKTFFVTKIAIGNTDVDLQDQDARIRLTARGMLTLEVGDGVALNGQITTVKGTAELVGRRYRIEQGTITYDGTTDPRLDIRVVHDFKNLTLTVEVTGRGSKPDPRLRGDPDRYTEGQLWSFLLGADPGDGDSNQAGQAVVSGGLSILSGRLGAKLNRYLPVKFDTINYEAETAASSKAVRFGLQLSEKTYLVWRQRLAARPDENPGEAVIEYQFRPNFLFEGTIGERNKGGDFLWRKRW